MLSKEVELRIVEANLGATGGVADLNGDGRVDVPELPRWRYTSAPSRRESSQGPLTHGFRRFGALLSGCAT